MKQLRHRQEETGRDIHLLLPSVLAIPSRAAGSQKFRLHIFWKREGNLCVGDKKKSPNSNHAHRTTSHKTEHHWEKMGSHGGNLDCNGLGGAGWGQHLRKRSLLNGNQMGCVFLNRIPDSQRGREPGWGLSPWLLRGQRVRGVGGRRWQAPRLGQGGIQTRSPGSGSALHSPCHAVSQPFARISKLEAYREAILSFPPFFRPFFEFFLFAV